MPPQTQFTLDAESTCRKIQPWIQAVFNSPSWTTTFVVLQQIVEETILYHSGKLFHPSHTTLAWVGNDVLVPGLDEVSIWLRYGGWWNQTHLSTWTRNIHMHIMNVYTSVYIYIYIYEYNWIISNICAWIGSTVANFPSLTWRGRRWRWRRRRRWWWWWWWWWRWQQFRFFGFFFFFFFFLTVVFVLVVVSVLLAWVCKNQHHWRWRLYKYLHDKYMEAFCSWILEFSHTVVHLRILKPHPGTQNIMDTQRLKL